jgi:hypothetical protein
LSDDSDDDSDDYEDFEEESKSHLTQGNSLGGSSLDSVDPLEYKAAMEKIRINKKMRIALDKQTKRLDDEYYKIKKIGEGSFGKVYLIKHL